MVEKVKIDDLMSPEIHKLNTLCWFNNDWLVKYFDGYSVYLTSQSLMTWKF